MLMVVVMVVMVVSLLKVVMVVVTHSHTLTYICTHSSSAHTHQHIHMHIRTHVHTLLFRYDGNFLNRTRNCSTYAPGCGLMQMYDVGMTSMWVQEAFALAELARLIGRPTELSAMLDARAKAVSEWGSG